MVLIFILMKNRGAYFKEIHFPFLTHSVLFNVKKIQATYLHLIQGNCKRKLLYQLFLTLLSYCQTRYDNQNKELSKASSETIWI